jgi:hypothetical protein
MLIYKSHIYQRKYVLIKWSYFFIVHHLNYYIRDIISDITEIKKIYFIIYLISEY